MTKGCTVVDNPVTGKSWSSSHLSVLSAEAPAHLAGGDCPSPCRIYFPSHKEGAEESQNAPMLGPQFSANQPSLV